LAALALLVVSPPPRPSSQPIQFSHQLHLDYFQDGRHRQSMVSLHEELLMKELGDKAAVAEIVKEVEKGGCTVCHRDFDQNAQNLAKLGHCGECHRGFIGREWQGRSDQRPCLGCHSTAGESPQASLPNTNTCAACHQPPLGGGREETKLLEFVNQNSQIPWTRVYDYLPGDIVFSHERHVELARVKCQECHGLVQHADRPLSLQVKLTMEDCMACHEATQANNDCLACHK
jgi:c(7)-type cytochrome triheme protein